jgi:hypothetical protein
MSISPKTAMTNSLANFIKYSTIGGATLMCLTLLSQPAQAIRVTVNSTQYDVTAFTAISDQTHYEKALSKAQSRDHNVGTNQEHFHQ